MMTKNTRRREREGECPPKGRMNVKRKVRQREPEEERRARGE